MLISEINRVLHERRLKFLSDVDLLRENSVNSAMFAVSENRIRNEYLTETVEINGEQCLLNKLYDDLLHGLHCSPSETREIIAVGLGYPDTMSQLKTNGYIPS